MLHHRPLRALLCLTLLVVLPLVTHAQEPWRAEAQAFLADPAIVPLTLAANARLSGAPQGWPGDLRSVSCPEGGYLIVDKAGEHLIGYVAPAPKPPVPADKSPRRRRRRSPGRSWRVVCRSSPPRAAR